MLTKLRNWFSGKPAAEDMRPRTALPVTPPQSTASEVPGRTFERGERRTDDTGNMGAGGSAVNRPRFVREETGTHETLKILDDSIFDDTGSEGLDPYNTGCFDRSKTWDRPFNTK